MTTAPQLEWIRPPKQARSRATLDRLLDAAEVLLGEKAWEDVGVADIVRRAGSSVGAFYARFRDKDALLNTLFERFVAEAQATSEGMADLDRWREFSVSGAVEAIIGFRVRVYGDRVGLLRAVLLRAVYDHSFQERMERLVRHSNDGFVALIISRRREILHPEPAIAAEFASQIVTNFLQSRLLFHESGDVSGRPWNAERITTELTHACLAYLGVFPESPRDM